MRRTSYIFLLLFVPAQLALIRAVDLDRIAQDLTVTYDVDRHNPPSPVYGHSFLANISLLNTGKVAIPASGWSIYFCHNPLIQPLYYNSTEAQYLGGGLILSGNITLTHVKGCMFKFEPYSGTNADYMSVPLQPGETRNISFLASNTAVTRFDVYPYWYVANDTHTSVIQNTANDVPMFVTPHSTFLKWQRSVPTDLYGTPLGLWNRYTGTNFTDAAATKYAIIPTPRYQSIGNTNVTVDKTWTIDRDRDGRLIGVANYLKKSIKGITIKNKKRSAKKIIQLYIRRNRPASESPETYRIRVKPKSERIEIGGNTVHGVFNGIQTLFSLLAFDGTIAEMNITDSPRFSYRGIQLDVASNFVPKSTVMKLLNVMALYKLNKLQLNLANNEGWRIEIPEIPELTQIGGKRCHDLTETKCLFPQHGSGPDNTTIGSGYYTEKDYTDIIRAAKQRHIEIIPSVDMAGKSRAAIVAMKAYEKRTGDKSMRIYDERDAPNTRYVTDELYNDAVINPCIKTVDRFFNFTLRKLVQYHARAKSPLKLLNIGGNDAPLESRINSSYCKALNLPGPDPFMFMKVNYTTRLANIASQSDVNLGGMEEFFSAWPTSDQRGGILVPFSRNRFPSNIDLYPITANSFDPLTFQRAQVMANVGYKVILSPSDFVSLDHAPEPDPEIPGDYWAIRHIQATRVFNYLPDNRCCNLNPDEFRYGKFTPNGCIDSEDCVKLEHPGNITGMQAVIWTKKIRNEDQLFGLAFPRLLAFAERAWHKADWEKTYVGRANRTTAYISPDIQANQKDWARFASIVGHKELKRLEAYGINHRVPPPGVHIDPLYTDPFDGKNKTVLLTDTAYPGLVPQVFGANQKWSDLGPITDITNLTAPTLTFRTRNAADTRYSIMEKMDSRVPNVYMAQLLASGVIMGSAVPDTSQRSVQGGTDVNIAMMPGTASAAGAVSGTNPSSIQTTNQNASTGNTSTGNQTPISG